MSFCKDCFVAIRHEGEPEGTFEKIGGEDCYVGTPKIDYTKDKVLLFLPDAFGMPLNNNLLLVDDYARNGFKTVLIDYFRGDPVPADVDLTTFNFGEWAGRVRPGTRPAIDAVIAALKGRGVTRFAAIGYCYGGRYTFDLAFENVIHVSAVSHPSLLTLPGDLTSYAEKSQAPLLINSCETDPQFPLEGQKQADEILGGGKFKPGYLRTYWDGCRHGFAVQGDMSNPKIKAGKEGSFKASVEWFLERL